MDFAQIEDENGVRFSWNVWPNTRIEATKLVVPLGCLYSPFKKSPAIPLVSYEPVYCKGACRSILNPYCSVDFRGRLWVCPFCYQRNAFPPQYNDISENNLPAELIANYTTIEYTLRPLAQPPPPIFLFLLDTCMPEEELKCVKESLLLALTMLPPNAVVGLIAFGTTVQVYELAFIDCPKSYVFRGTKDVTSKDLAQFLGLNKGAAVRQQTPGMAPNTLPFYAANRFLQPIADCEFMLTSILDEIQRDPRPVKNDRRPLRSTGVALSVAVGLLENTCGNTGGRVMLFVGGPATQGPGMVVGEELKEQIRAHHDLATGKAPHTQKAQKFYEALAKRVVQNGQVVDVFACSYDQIGIMEMKDLVERTGGLLVLADEFASSMFKNSFKKIFEKDDRGNLNMAFNATIEVVSSREIKVCGAVGHCTSLEKKTAAVSETEIGISSTTAWKMCGMDKNSTLAIYLEVANQGAAPSSQAGLIQLVTQYQHSSGLRVLRVTTICRAWGDLNAGPQMIGSGFDQEASAVLMARIGVFKTENEEVKDILRWLDRMLIRLVSKFADYRKEDPSSFKLPPNFAIYPQFMFHLRRSHFLQLFNNSPDETTYYRYMLLRENVDSSLIMIQPTLESYSFNGPPVPVVLSSTSVKKDCILLCDTFFHVVVFSGESIASWRNQGYQNDPQHENFRQLLSAPKDDAQAIMRDRFPYPRYIECDQGTGHQRFLLATIDPTLTHTSGGGEGEVIFTDDVSLKVFMEHLKKLAVQPQ
jgi:protein transport protein SEC23